MAPYEAFPIADFKYGEYLRREPFLAPADGFTFIQNGIVRKGAIQKRRGRVVFGYLGVPQDDSDTFGSSAVSGSFSKSPLTPILGNYTITWTDDGTHNYECRPEDFVSGSTYSITRATDHAVVGSVDFGAATFSLTWDSSPPTGGTVTWSYQYIRDVLTGTNTQNMVMGIENYVPHNVSELVLVFDRRRWWKWDPSAERFVCMEPQDAWASEPEDFIQSAAFDEDLVVVNGLDVIYYVTWTGSDVDLLEVQTDWNNPTFSPPAPGDAPSGGYTREIDSAKFVFRMSNRCVLLGTKETGVWRLNRARWSHVNPDFTDGASWDPGGFEDAPTNDFLVTAEQYGNEIHCWFANSRWKLIPFDDPLKVFTWVRVPVSDENSVARRSAIEIQNSVAALGVRGPMEWDGISTRRPVEELHDVALEWDPDALKYSFGFRSGFQNRAWWTYATGEGLPGQALVINYEDRVASRWISVPLHCYGSYRQASVDQAWDDFSETWDELTRAWDVASSVKGFPLVLAGGRANTQGLKVFQIDTGLADESLPIYFELRTAEINPFLRPQDGVRWNYARLQMVDILMDPQVSGSLRVDVYGDKVRHVSKTVSMVPSDSSGDLLMRRVGVNRKARAHQVRLINYEQQDVKIHAITFWLKPIGRVNEQK